MASISREESSSTPSGCFDKKKARPKKSPRELKRIISNLIRENNEKDERLRRLSASFHQVRKECVKVKEEIIAKEKEYDGCDIQHDETRRFFSLQGQLGECDAQITEPPTGHAGGQDWGVPVGLHPPLTECLSPHDPLPSPRSSDRPRPTSIFSDDFLSRQRREAVEADRQAFVRKMRCGVRESTDRHDRSGSGRRKKRGKKTTANVSSDKDMKDAGDARIDEEARDKNEMTRLPDAALEMEEKSEKSGPNATGCGTHPEDRRVTANMGNVGNDRSGKPQARQIQRPTLQELAGNPDDEEVAKRYSEADHEESEQVGKVEDSLLTIRDLGLEHDLVTEAHLKKAQEKRAQAILRPSQMSMEEREACKILARHNGMVYLDASLEKLRDESKYIPPGVRQTTFRRALTPLIRQWCARNKLDDVSEKVTSVQYKNLTKWIESWAKFETLLLATVDLFHNTIQEETSTKHKCISM